MNRLEEITDKVKEYKYLREKGKLLDQPRFSKLLNSFPADIEYLLQRLERYETALTDICNHTDDQDNNLGFTYYLIAKEALKGDE
jgi:hypothetical protein